MHQSCARESGIYFSFAYSALVCFSRELRFALSVAETIDKRAVEGEKYGSRGGPKRRIAIALVFLAGLAIGYYARGAVGTLRPKDTHAADLAGIEKLHQEDIEVTLSQDPKGLIDVWTEDGVRLNPGSPPVVGKQAIAVDNEKNRVQYPEFRVLKYAPNINEVQIADGGAIEVGSVEATYRLSAKDNPVSVHDKGMRLLKRQNDGSWKFALVGMK